VRRQGESLEAHDFGGYETRNQSTFKLLAQADIAKTQASMRPGSHQKVSVATDTL
jgi:hypothetical protein